MRFKLVALEIFVLRADANSGFGESVPENFRKVNACADDACVYFFFGGFFDLRRSA